MPRRKPSAPRVDTIFPLCCGADSLFQHRGIENSTALPEGHVRLNQLFQPVKAGAVSGAMWGSLIGLLFLMPLAGAAIGAASGALTGRLTDVGINGNSQAPHREQERRSWRYGGASVIRIKRG